MSAPGSFGSGGGDGTGPPTKRPKMDETDNQTQGNNPLDNIFGVSDDGGMGLPANELMQAWTLNFFSNVGHLLNAGFFLEL